MRLASNALCALVAAAAFATAMPSVATAQMPKLDPDPAPKKKPAASHHSAKRPSPAAARAKGKGSSGPGWPKRPGLCGAKTRAECGASASCRVVDKRDFLCAGLRGKCIASAKYAGCLARGTDAGRHAALCKRSAGRWRAGRCVCKQPRLGRGLSALRARGPTYFHPQLGCRSLAEICRASGHLWRSSLFAAQLASQPAREVVVADPADATKTQRSPMCPSSMLLSQKRVGPVCEVKRDGRFCGFKRHRSRVAVGLLELLDAPR